MTAAKSKLVTCPACHGSGRLSTVIGGVKCFRCDGAGKVARKAKAKK